MAGHGVIGLAFCNSPIHGHHVAPPGGREGRLATNPIAYGLPSEDSDVIADFSTSSMPEGVVRLLHRRGLTAPTDTLMTSDGTPTRDPGVIYGEPPGTILPLGGTEKGHKGFALSILVQAMAGALSGDRVADLTLRGNNLALIGIAPHGLTDSSFPSLVSDLSAYIKSAKPIDPNRPVQMPGDREQLVREQRLREGIPVDDFTWSEVTHWAAQLGHPIEESRLSDG
jgi:LDH2 family malate/lactate/ureidoglycolate dehydrogenase